MDKAIPSRRSEDDEAARFPGGLRLGWGQGGGGGFDVSDKLRMQVKYATHSQKEIQNIESKRQYKGGDGGSNKNPEVEPAWETGVLKLPQETETFFICLRYRDMGLITDITMEVLNYNRSALKKRYFPSKRIGQTYHILLYAP